MTLHQPSRKTSVIFLGVILLIGFLFRFYVITQYPMGPNTFSDDNGYTTSGMVFYNTGYVSYADPGLQTTAICVGMPALLNGIFTLTGTTPEGLTAAHLVFACIGLVSAIGVYLLGTELRGRRAGLFGAALCALLPDMVSVNSVFLTETPFLCLNLFAGYFLMRCTKEWHLPSFWLGTLCLCAAALFKGLALLALVVPLAMLIKRKVPLRRWLFKALILALVFCLVFAPWWLRNFLAVDRFVPFTANRGDLQLMGTYEGIGCPPGDYTEMSDDLIRIAWEEGYQEDMERRFEVRGQVAAERVSMWIRQHPVGFIVTQLFYKPFLLVARHLSPIPVIPGRLGDLLWYGVLVLAAVGLLLPTLRKRSVSFEKIPAVYLLAAVYCTSIYCPLARYGVPYVPFWLLYAAFGADELLNCLLSGKTCIERDVNR